MSEKYSTSKISLAFCTQLYACLKIALESGKVARRSLIIRESERERERDAIWGEGGEDFMIEIVEIRLTRKPETFHFPKVFWLCRDKGDKVSFLPSPSCFFLAAYLVSFWINQVEIFLTFLSFYYHSWQIVSFLWKRYFETFYLINISKKILSSLEQIRRDKEIYTISLEPWKNISINIIDSKRNGILIRSVRSI